MQGATLNFHRIDDEGTLGTIIKLNEINDPRVPQSTKSAQSLNKRCQPMFTDVRILELAGCTVIVLPVHPNHPHEVKYLTNDLNLVELEWNDDQ